MKNEIVLFEAKDGKFAMPVQVKAETVWLTQAQMAQLFNKDRTVIGRHISNAIVDGEIDSETMCAKFAYMGKDADQTYWTEAYNLDVIISVGYRVKSQRGVEFRRWATSVLKDYLVRGYVVNHERMRQLGQTVEVMKRVANSLDVDQVLDVVNAYSTALDLLDGYDHQTIEKPKTKGRSVELTYEECRRFIDSMKFAADSPLFGTFATTIPLNDAYSADGYDNTTTTSSRCEAIKEMIKNDSGINKLQLMKLLGKSRATVERVVAALIAVGKVEHRGSKKTGGSYAVNGQGDDL